MKENVSAVKHNKFWVPDLDKVNVEHIVNCAEGEKEGENLEIKTVEYDSSRGECGEDLCLLGTNLKEEDAAVSIGG